MQIWSNLDLVMHNSNVLAYFLSPLGFVKMVDPNIFNFHIKNMNIFLLDEIFPKKRRCDADVMFECNVHVEFSQKKRCS